MCVNYVYILNIYLFMYMMDYFFFEVWFVNNVLWFNLDVVMEFLLVVGFKNLFKIFLRF